MRAPRAVPRLILAGLGFFLITLFAQNAKADGIYLDFGCGGPTCGTVTASGGNFSTTGITVTEDSGFYPAGSTFLLVFNTATSTVSLIGQGALTGENFLGTITGFSDPSGFSTTDLQFTAVWPTIPADVQALFNSDGGWDSGFSIFMSSSGTNVSTDVTITPAPEPGSTAMLLVGMVGLGLMLTRKAAVLA